ncbi:MAG TPA: hypothetical protein PK668_05830 [Myxococcota bacterium]|nr:hypothetical protein [Myxococcota bacterium]HRY92640.1 hypothetical protein [Myxococcota bacterium]
MLPINPRIVVLGHSHIRTIAAAAGKTKTNAVFSFVDLNDARFKSSARVDKGDIRLRAELQEEISRIKTEDPTALFALSIGGAMHNVIGLTKHPDPFSFFNPWKPERESVGRLLPFTLIKEMMREALSYQLLVLRGLARALGRPLPQLQSPPPVSSEDAIRSTPGVYGESIAKFGVVNASSRYAMWRVQSDLFEEVAREEGCDFLLAPKDAVGEDGFLIQKAWRDPTHGNVWYGECVLRQLEQYFCLSEGI